MKVNNLLHRAPTFSLLLASHEELRTQLTWISIRTLAASKSARTCILNLQSNIVVTFLISFLVNSKFSLLNLVTSKFSLLNLVTSKFSPDYYVYL